MLFVCRFWGFLDMFLSYSHYTLHSILKGLSGSLWKHMLKSSSKYSVRTLNIFKRSASSQHPDIWPLTRPFHPLKHLFLTGPIQWKPAADINTHSHVKIICMRKHFKVCCLCVCVWCVCVRVVCVCVHVCARCVCSGKQIAVFPSKLRVVSLKLKG